ncbi:MAG: peptidoglycan DD-metalloendopeptidase family protein [Acetatifactor sp.]
MRNNRKQNIRKERIIMIASSAFVMAALTMTGVYMKENSAQNQDNGYSIDFTEIEDQAGDNGQNTGGSGQNQNTQTPGNIPHNATTVQEFPEDDLDYLPMEEAGSSLIQIPGLTDGIRSEADVTSDEQLAMLEEQKAAESQSQEREDKPQESSRPESGAATAAPALEQPMLPEQTFVEQGPVLEEQPVMEGQPVWEAQPETRILGFSADQGLVRPVTGDVLIPYSMDRTVYFTTLDQYKYNPATVYRVEEGTQVMACAEARVASVFSNEEIGQAVTLDLGNGYQVVYGQLQSLNVSEGDYVSPGQIIATVAAPTIYYSLEGSNLYFLLEQDGAALDPQSMYF